jgi:hypothetical protein
LECVATIVLMAEQAPARPKCIGVSAAVAPYLK